MASARECCMESRGHKFHVGNLSLYLDPVDGKLRARANMMVYRKCKKGLVENIRALKRLLDYVSKKANVIAIGKGYRDSICVYVVGDANVTLPKRFRDVGKAVIRHPSMEKAVELYHDFHSSEEGVGDTLMRRAL